MRVLIDVEYIRDAEFAESYHPMVHAALTAEPIGGGLDNLTVAVKIEGVAYENPR